MNQTEKEIARIIKEQVELMNLCIDAGVDPRKVTRLVRWNVLEAALLWYDFELWISKSKLCLWMERKIIKPLNDRLGN